MLQSVERPRGMFKGSNFMTPRILGYYAIKDGGFAELSQGEGISRRSIFGVTVEPRSAGESKMFYSHMQAVEYIEVLAGAHVEDLPMPWCDHCRGYHHSTADCI